MLLAILCSGQGQQNAGMFDLVANAPEAAKLFEVAAGLLDGNDPRDLVRNAGSEVLEANRTAQILCVLQAVALHAALGDALPKRRLIAGYSVGEVAAWALAGLIGGADVLHLVAARAEAMDEASRGKEGLTFVRGLTRKTVEACCRESDVALAIVDPGDGFVVGGAITALNVFEKKAAENGAQRLVRLRVHVASHTPRLTTASVVFAKTLQGVTMGSATATGVRLFSGIDGAAVIDCASGRTKLANQISQTVEWASCLESCAEAGATAFLEFGPGHALSSMVSEAIPGVSARSAGEFRTLAGLRTWIANRA